MPETLVIHETEWRPLEFQKYIEECIEAVDRAHYRLNQKTDLISAAYALTELHDAIGALKSWHRKYDYETVEIENFDD